MQIKASLVKELRDRTGSGMMDCKQALLQANGDIEAAIEIMRKSGAAKAAKKAGRIAAEGIISIKEYSDSVIMAEVNCETDFVAKDDDFVTFSDSVIEHIARENPADVSALMASSVNGHTVEELNQKIIAKIGEKVTVRRFIKRTITERSGYYLHGTRIGVIVELQGGDASLAKDVAMHIAACKPICVSEDQLPAELLEKEKAIFLAQAKESKKPDHVIEKMVSGRLNKFLKEVTLLGQPFVKDPDQSVGALLKSAHASVSYFLRYEVGEGMEKRVDNFAEEVMAQAKGG